MKIGYKSDIHLDFWVGDTGKEEKIEEFVRNILSPQEMDVLIIAGDLGHFNYQNFLLLKILKKWAKKILFCFGNHNLYLVDNEKYKNSFERLAKLKEMVSTLEEVYFLDGDIVEMEGIKFLGAGGWYDLSYGVKHGYSLEYLKREWEIIMNDSRMIVPKLDVVDFSFVQKEKLRQNIDKADIVFTHVAPVYISCHNDAVMDSFYTFYGYDLLKDNIKYWIFGHCHKPMDFYEEMIRFVSSPLGYPFVRTGEFEIKYLNLGGI
jgi:predicted MPP superfamily phosphohydrolase